MARDDPAGAELVRLRAYAGLTLGEAADVMGIGRRTADRYWAYARAWLCDALSAGEDAAPSDQKNLPPGASLSKTEHGEEETNQSNL